MKYTTVLCWCVLVNQYRGTVPVNTWQQAHSPPQFSLGRGGGKAILAAKEKIGGGQLLTAYAYRKMLAAKICFGGSCLQAPVADWQSFTLWHCSLLCEINWQHYLMYCLLICSRSFLLLSIHNVVKNSLCWCCYITDSVSVVCSLLCRWNISSWQAV